MSVLRHPILWVLLVLIALTIGWDAIGAPVSLITQIAIYTLYGAGVNLLVGYTGLVPFGASVFFGCASYAVAISLRGFLTNEAEALIFAISPRSSTSRTSTARSAPSCRARLRRGRLAAGGRDRVPAVGRGGAVRPGGWLVRSCAGASGRTAGRVGGELQDHKGHEEHKE